LKLDAQIVRAMVAQALAEDLGAGDVTAQTVLPEDTTARAVIVSHATGVMAGLPVAQEALRQLSERITFRPLLEDGGRLEEDVPVAEIDGPCRPIVTAERVALNFLQRLSGIATYTRRCVDAVAPHETAIVDTRKTTPGLRYLEKYAVRVGGGKNHRMGLDDQVLIKDNHLKIITPDGGDIQAAVRLAVKRARQALGVRMLIEVETESLPMVEAAVEAGADIIMLDNMTLEQMTTAAQMIRRYREKRSEAHPITEASGGVTLDNLPAVAATGVDTISIGALTHSAPALDLSMDMI